jgi:hypothetical protein
MSFGIVKRLLDRKDLQLEGSMPVGQSLSWGLDEAFAAHPE